MLATCAHMGWSTEDYLEANHPLQRRVAALLHDASNDVLATAGDGCGLPTYWSTLQQCAVAFAEFSSSKDASAQRVQAAMATHPMMVAGRERPCTAVAEATAGRVLGKVGASGAYVLWQPGTREVIAVKVESGRMDAAECAALALAERDGWFNASEQDSLADYIERPVLDCAGRRRGVFRLSATK